MAIEDIDEFYADFLIAHAAEGSDNAGTLFMLGMG
jgi:predicted peroxiredoxin